MADKNKIKFGLANVWYARATLAEDNSATYETPVRWPGAVNLSMDPSGELVRFYADDIVYWAGEANNGYEGDFESALVPDSFKKDIEPARALGCNAIWLRGSSWDNSDNAIQYEPTVTSLLQLFDMLQQNA